MHKKEGREGLWERESPGFLDDVDRLKHGYSRLNNMEVKLSTYLEGSTQARDTFTPRSAKSIEINPNPGHRRTTSRVFTSPRASIAPSGCCFNTHNNICGSTRAVSYSTDTRALQDHRRDSGFAYRQSHISELQHKADRLKTQNAGFAAGTPGRDLYPRPADRHTALTDRPADRYESYRPPSDFKFVPSPSQRESVLRRYNTSIETNYFGMERSLAGEITKMARGFEEEKDHLMDLIQTQARMIHDLQSSQMGAGRPKSVRFIDEAPRPTVRTVPGRRTYYAWAN